MARRRCSVLVNERAAAGHAVRADPLVGDEQLASAYRRAGACGSRPVFGPARGESDARPYPGRRAVSHYGFALARSAVETATARLLGGARAFVGHVMFFALDAPSTGWAKFAESELPGGERLIYEDANQGMFRTAVLQDNRSGRDVRRPAAEHAINRLAEKPVSSEEIAQ